MSQTYVYEGTEVRKTGRTATKQGRTVGTRYPQSHTLVEITPVDSTFDWKKWVDEKLLYEVHDE